MPNNCSVYMITFWIHYSQDACLLTVFLWCGWIVNWLWGGWVFSQAEVCSGTVAEVIQSVVNGADGCIFCFGQVKLGKLLHWQQIRQEPLLAKENSHCSLLATLDVHNWLSGALGWVKEWEIGGKEWVVSMGWGCGVKCCIQASGLSL